MAYSRFALALIPQSPIYSLLNLPATNHSPVTTEQQGEGKKPLIHSAKELLSITMARVQRVGSQDNLTAFVILGKVLPCLRTQFSLLLVKRAGSYLRFSSVLHGVL